MKFAKEIEQDLVPEWRAKYFDYKTGKKKVKAVSRALRNVNHTPRMPGRQLPASLLNDRLERSIPQPSSNHTSFRATPKSLGKLTAPEVGEPETGESTPKDSAPKDGDDLVGHKSKASPESSPIAVPGATSGNRISHVSTTQWDSGEVTNYGSFVPSPSSRTQPLGPPALELPDPALPPDEHSFPKNNPAWRHSHFNPHQATPQSQHTQGKPGDAYQVGRPQTSGKSDSSYLLPKHKRFLRPRRTVSTPHAMDFRPRPLMRRIFSSSAPGTPQGDVPLEAYKAYDEKNAEFFKFLDLELIKIESFYKMKETQANQRLQLLRNQLHEMRDRRIDEIRYEQEVKRHSHLQNEHVSSGHDSLPRNHANSQIIRRSAAMKWVQPVERAIGLGSSRIGKTSKALQHLGSPSTLPEHSHPQHPPGSSRPESWRDFTRRPPPPEIPYRSAKRKLKLALQEFYRGLELLKSYALLNRTAFRKINKKYDKAIKARPTQRYMTDKVNKSWFVQSEVLDHQIVAVEDLYARYFERGNHKVAVGKLRKKTSKAADFTGSVFRNGMLLAAGAVFGIQGIVYAAEHLYSPDAAIRLETSYVLQIYGGYFLMLFLFLIFCLDCKIWTRAKINYPFIFEFDARHSLDWHQLSEIPCLLLFLLGLCIWLNFQQDRASDMFLYWPVLLIALSVVVLFFPGPVLYHRSREWWAYSNFRLVFAGLYPVEFRDFFLGDMYCSQTYSMGNLELFFCLYAHNWANPTQCNSNHSRLLGFFSTLPGIWRALQCLRRYYDTRNAFPHLVNCGKYTFTILSYLTLSLYRIDRTMSLKALFIACSTLNSVYCSTWDLAMDWSLLNPYAQRPFLRDVLGYKRPEVYYAAMVLDPILRFNWIFYAIFSNDLQHSALLSFLVAFSEVCRRGIWTLFRVENEHCTNVGRFRASRDVPLPYAIPSPSQTPSPTDVGNEVRDELTVPVTRSDTYVDGPAGATSSSLEAQQTPSLRRRTTLTDKDTPIIRGIARVGTAINQAHAQDFERKRKPTEKTSGVEGLERSPHHQGAQIADDDSSEEDADDEEEREMEAEARRNGDSAAAESGQSRREDDAEVHERNREDMAEVEDVIGRRRSAVD